MSEFPSPTLAGTSKARVVAHRGGRSEPKDDWLVEERPVALVFNGISHAVMLASPVDLEDFATGFALSEGLVDSRAEIYGIDVAETDRGVTVGIEVASAAEFRIKARRRNLTGRTGCGLCGTESLDQVLRTLPAASASAVDAVPIASIGRAMASLSAGQPIQQRTGAAHAAAACDAQGHVMLLREDVGRHNALDKLIGALARIDGDGRWDARPAFFAVTSRASMEMVQKTAMAQVAMLVAVSAPTSLAVDIARDAGIALAGFVRGDDLVVYAHVERFGLPTDPEKR